MSVADAIKAGFLSALDKDTADMFILLELRLYQHAQDHRSNWDIQGYPRLSQVIPADSQVIPDMTVFRAGGTVPLAIVIYIDGSFVKHIIPVKPI